MNRKCPICGSNKKKILFKQRFGDNVLTLMSGYDVVVCKICGFAFADKIPSQSKFNSYYRLMSKYEYSDKEGVVSNDSSVYFNKVAKYLIPILGSKNANILDIGCSTGKLLSIFKSKGYKKVLGVDPSLTCVFTAANLYGVKVKQANISNFRSKIKFDLIILSATFEHLVNFDEAMNKIRSLLKPGGYLFVEVPDAEKFENYISSPFQQFSTEHINYFSRITLGNLMKQYSFDIIQVKQNINKINLSVEPDLFMLSQKTEKKEFILEKDGIVRVKLIAYIKKCAKLNFNIKKSIRKQLAKIKKMIVWGVGTHTLRLLGVGLPVSKILFFVDSNNRYIGRKLRGRVIKAPCEIGKTDIPILISTYGYQDEIHDQIRNGLGLNNKIIILYKFK